MSGELIKNTIVPSEDLDRKVSREPGKITKIIPERFFRLTAAARIALALSAAGGGTAAYSQYALAQSLENPGDCLRIVDISSGLDRPLNVILKFDNTDKALAEGLLPPQGKLQLRAVAASNSTGRDRAGNVRAAWKDSLGVKENPNFRRDVGHGVNNLNVFCGDAAKVNFFPTESATTPGTPGAPVIPVVPGTRGVEPQSQSNSSSESASRAGTTNIITNSNSLSLTVDLGRSVPPSFGTRYVMITERITDTVEIPVPAAAITSTDSFWDGFFGRFRDRNGVPVDVRNFFPEPYQNALAYWAGPAAIALAVLAAGFLAGRRSNSTAVVDAHWTAERDRLLDEREAAVKAQEEMRVTNTQLNNDLLTATVRAQNAEEQLKNIKTGGEDTRRRNVELESENKDLIRQREEAVVAREAAEAQRDELITDKERLKKDNEAVHERLRQHAADQQAAAQQRSAAEQERDELRQRVTKLEEELKRKEETPSAPVKDRPAMDIATPPAPPTSAEPTPGAATDARERQQEVDRLALQLNKIEQEVAVVRQGMEGIRDGVGNLVTETEQRISQSVERIIESLNNVISRVSNIEASVENLRTKITELRGRSS